MYIKRTIQQSIESKLFKGKIIVVYGPRQVGKTTLAKKIIEKYQGRASYFLCEEPDVKAALTNKTSTEMKNFLGENDLVVLDEAQVVENIGMTLKLLIDNYPEMQIIATGSSSFDLANKISEPLTGRKNVFMLYPLSIEEITQEVGKQEVARDMERLLRYGLYPEVYLSNNRDAEDILKEITPSYLFKDLLTYQDIRNPEVLRGLLTALALRVGNEVSYRELSNLLNVDKETIQRYVELLEQIYVVFSLRPFSRNLRKEIGKKRKIYFYDLGVRNALINNFNRYDLRNDVGVMWENLCIVERKKLQDNNNLTVSNYFWRTYDQDELDLVEDRGGNLYGYEIKWNEKKGGIPVEWFETYPHAEGKVINRNNFIDFASKVDV